MRDAVKKELPDNWVWSTMGEISEVVGGGTPKSKEKLFYEGGEIPWLTPADLSGYKSKYIAHGARFITEQGLAKSSAKLMPAGTVLFTSRAPVGYVVIAQNEICTNQGFKSFVLKSDEILPDYAYWWLKGSKQLAESYASGTTFLELSGAKAKQLPIPVAPPEQQKQIVAKIEELFSHIDAGIESLKKAKQLLKKYRQSVLKAAVTGELTKEWREKNKDKLEPASKLLERILKERRQKWEEQQLETFKAKGKIPKNDKWKERYQIPSIAGCLVNSIDQSWLKVNMGILKYHSIYGPRFSSSDYSEKGVIVLRTTDMDERGKVKIENAPKLGLSDNDYARYQVEQGDLLITRTGSIGTLAIFQDDCRAIPGAYLLHYKFTKDVVSPTYIYLVFKSPSVQKTLTSSTQGIGRPNLNAPTLESIDFNLPSLKEQKLIIDITNEKFASINRLEEEIEKKLKKIERNKQSTLASAFSGRLSNET